MEAVPLAALKADRAGETTEVARFDFLEFEEERKPEADHAAAEEVRAELRRDERDWLKQADAQRRQGYYENALRMYSRALEGDKSIVAGWLGQVQMLVFLGEAPEAELWARKALELFKNHGDLTAGRAQALGRMGDATTATALSDAAMRFEGQSAYRWMVRGELMIRSRDEVQRHCFEKATQIDRDWLVPLEIALAYLHHGVPSKGATYARRVVEQRPESVYAWLVQGRCEQELGLTKAAARSYARCLEIVPGHLEATRSLEAVEAGGWSPFKAIRRWLGRS